MAVGKVSELNQEDQELVKTVARLHELMDQFTALDTTGMDLDTLHAYQNATAAIQEGLNHPSQDDALRTALGLNEFMAWGLANQKLADLQAKTMASPLVQLVKDTLQALKRLFFGRSTTPKAADDMLSNLMFNTSILVRTQASIQAQMADTNLFMNVRYGNDERLTTVNQTFQDLITTYATAKGDRVVAASRVTPVALAVSRAQDMAQMAHDQGFHMNQQEMTTFKLLVGALSTQASIDPSAMGTAQELYTHVVKHLDPEMFMPSGLSRKDPEWGKEHDLASSKWRVIVGKEFSYTDEQGRSSLLPVFLGLAAVNNDFRNVLSKMPMPTTALKGVGPKTLDGVLENTANFSIEKLSRWLSGTNKSKTIEAATDALFDHIQSVSQERQSFIDQYASAAGSIADRGDEITIQAMTKLSEAAVKVGEGLVAKSNNKLSE